VEREYSDRHAEELARIERRRMIASIFMTVVGIAGAVAFYWQVSLPPPETATVLAPEGRKVFPISKTMALPPIDDRQARSEIVPSEEATHVIYPVYYGTDRLPKSPFGGVPFGTVVLCGAAIAAAVAAVICFIWKWKKFGVVLVLAFAGLAFWAWSPQPKKINPLAAAAYGHDRGDLRYGVCSVSIPHSHQSGMLEAPSLLSFEFREDADKHIVLQRVDPMELSEFSKNLKDQVEYSAWPEALVFIHGYNVTFEDAARRSAQIAYDIKFGGVAAVFSWPSIGDTPGYTWDEQSAQYATPHLTQFLQTLAKEGNLKRIHVIAHSMGNRCLFEALRREPDLGECRIDQCVFAAPDVDRDVFKREFRDIVNDKIPESKRIANITLYASDKDKALMGSQVAHRYPRAGDAGGGVVLVDGVESIEASKLETDYLGHSYVGDSANVVADLRQMIENRLMAGERSKMTERKVGSHKYWVFQP